MRRALILSSLTLVLAACQPPAAPKGGDADRPASRDIAVDFYHAIDAEQSGYYIPAEPVSVDGWTLDHLFMGQKTDFRACG